MKRKPAREAVPDLGPGLPVDGFPNGGVGYSIEINDLDTISDFDGYVAAANESMGRFVPAALDLAETVDFVRVVESQIQFTVSAPQNGTVVLEANGEQTTVFNGDVVTVEAGTEVTVAATATTPHVVHSMTSTAGTVTGVGISEATVPFIAEEGDSVRASFSTLN